ncbi:hypothetical protein K0M31_000685 [Melipona bicolor]|uniref:Structure-specific endonuclease subunit SLX4 n=1 Tax=Melipona bicolor TaxID=60889 RepID=A0AA40GEA9_9HYME|nr:hypothetical protein K0M31_000685 [Melipona bicolor]
MDEHLEDNKLSHTSGLNEDDSLLDFKSPKQKSIEFNHCNIYQKKRTVAKLKNVKSYKGEKHKQHSEKKRNMQESQPSIESSFFKSKANCYDRDSTTDAKLALVCPLCFKTFKDLNSHALHMKICADKNNISTKKLLSAIELQKRQENERISLGLPAAPIVQAKKKPTSSRKNLYEETDLQLALALSKSEAEELDKINEIESLPKILNQFMSETSKSVHVGQLEKFGFANNKPPSLIKNKKRKHNEITLLQTRSQEERNYILTEKISEILMGNEITQNQNGKIKCNRVIQKKNDLKSYFLQKCCNKEEKLWSKAKLSSNQKYFYVSNLSNYITSGEKQVNQETILDFANTCEIYDMKLNQYKTRIYNNKERDEISHTEARFVNEKCENYQNIQFIDAIITNWGNALNDSSASDIIIFVNNDKYIWAHKLIFHVQCPNILLDITPNNTLLFTKIKEKISWTDISYNIALAFLEFIYCGIIKKYLNVLDNLINFSCLRNLARRYKIKELFVFLEKKEIEIKQIGSQIHSKQDRELISEEKNNLEVINNNVENLIYGIKDSKLIDDEKLNKKHLHKSNIGKSQFTETKLRKNMCTDELLQEEINYFNDTNVIRNNNVSPDLFDDVNDTKQTEEIKNKTKYVNEIADSKKAKSNENSSIIDLANQVMIDTTNFSTFGSTTKLKNIEKDKNLFTDNTHFTTPKKGDCSNILKLKSNLSIFIEQVQRENARSNSDLDSDVSILSTCSKLYRNPFNIKQNDSFENNIIKETFKTKSDILDTFDCNTNFELKTKMSYEKNDSDISLNFESINMQSSESNVREYATSSMNKSINNAYENLQDEAIHSIFEENLLNENKNDKPPDFNTFSDEDEISMYSKYKEGHKNNSIVKYRNFVHKHIMKNNVIDNIIYDEYQNKNKMDNDSLLLNIDKDSKREISLTRKHDNENKIKKVIPNFEDSKKISQQNLCNFSNEYVTSEKYNYFFTNVTSLNTPKNIFKDQKLNTSNKLKYSKSESNIDLQAIKSKSSTDKHNSVETSILISSSPELSNNILYVHKYEGNKKSTSSLHYQNSENNSSHTSENDIYLANAYIDDNDDNINTLLFTEINQLEFKDNEKSLSKQKYSRKFKKKSMSETNLHIDTRHKEDIAESSNNSQCRCNYKKNLKTTVLPEIIEDSVTPPPDYNGMKTSELQAELNKYGLKIQKRKRAVKLLTYIYNELHPTINTLPRNKESELTVISSEDDEPPMKKRNSKKNDTDCALIDNGSNIKDMFLKLLSIKTELYNQILAYEPICINSLHFMLKTEGLKCKMDALMDFLDEQCITFYVQEVK